MEHLAIMHREWNLTEKILSGDKKIESRWYKARYAPWDNIKVGDIVYFKNSGEKVSIKAEVERVIQYSELNPQKIMEILNTFGENIGIEKEQINDYFNRFKDKKYCILVFIKNPQEVEHFEIDKKGFGMMSAWITTENIESIRK